MGIQPQARGGAYEMGEIKDVALDEVATAQVVSLA
jgi:hypothetical protein